MNFKDLLLKSRRLIIVASHLVLVICAYILAFYLRFDFKIGSSQWQVIIKTLPLIVCIKMIILGSFGLYSGLWRYASIDDIWRIIKAHVLAMMCFIAAVAFTHSLDGFPRSIFVLDCILSFCFVSGIRFVTRLLREIFLPTIGNKRKRAIIIGAGEAGVMILRESKGKE